MASAARIISGERTRMRSVEPTRSKVRLRAKSTPSNTGGFSSKSGERLSGHVLHAVHEDLHRRRRHPHAHALAVAAVHELDGLLRGEVGVGDQHLVDRVEAALELLERAEVAQAVEERDGRAGDEAVRLDLTAVVGACDTAWMFEPEPTSTARGGSPRRGGSRR